MKKLIFVLIACLLLTNAIVQMKEEAQKKSKSKDKASSKKLKAEPESPVYEDPDLTEEQMVEAIFTRDENSPDWKKLKPIAETFDSPKAKVGRRAYKRLILALIQHKEDLMTEEEVHNDPTKEAPTDPQKEETFRWYINEMVEEYINKITQEGKTTYDLHDLYEDIYNHRMAKHFDNLTGTGQDL